MLVFIEVVLTRSHGRRKHGAESDYLLFDLAIHPAGLYGYLISPLQWYPPFYPLPVGPVAGVFRAGNPCFIRQLTGTGAAHASPPALVVPCFSISMILAFWPLVGPECLLLQRVQSHHL